MSDIDICIRNAVKDIFPGIEIGTYEVCGLGHGVYYVRVTSPDWKAPVRFVDVHISLDESSEDETNA